MREQFPPTTPAADIALGCALTVVFHIIAIVLALGHRSYEFVVGHREHPDRFS